MADTTSHNKNLKRRIGNVKSSIEGG